MNLITMTILHQKRKKGQYTLCHTGGRKVKERQKKSFNVPTALTVWQSFMSRRALLVSGGHCQSNLFPLPSCIIRQNSVPLHFD